LGPRTGLDRFEKEESLALAGSLMKVFLLNNLIAFVERGYLVLVQNSDFLFSSP
jgi:hypothetical protein